MKLNRFPCFSCFSVSLLLAIHLASAADETAEVGKAYGRQVSHGDTEIRHSFLITGHVTAIVDENSIVTWTIPTRSRDGYVLPNGNVLISTGKEAQEHHPENGIVWSYVLDKANKELGTAVRLENGNTLVVERGVNPRLLEIAADGKVAVEVALQPESDNAHMQTRMARKLPNGNYLVPHLLAFKVKEYQPDGKVVREIPTDTEELGGRKGEAWPFTAIRLADERILVNLTHSNQVVEFDKDNKVVWRASNQEVGNRLADPCGGQRLPNGNTVICSYGQKIATMPKIFEITPDLNTVWEYFHPNMTGVHEVHVLTTNGEALGVPMK